MKRLLITVTLPAIALFAPGFIVPPGADAQPVEEWVARYNGPADDDDYARAMAADPATGNVYVTGLSYGSGTGCDFATVAYDSDGKELWVARYDGPADGDDIAFAIAVDSSRGNVYVTGGSYGSGTSSDYATVAYGSGGKELWVARYNGPADDYDIAFAMAVDPATGNVYATGNSHGSGTSSDYATVAYDADGNELWVARYNGPADDDDFASDITADPFTGNVYVAGGSYGNGTSYDYATVAYDSGGKELWVARYNGPADDYDGAHAITADPSRGNVYVTGLSHGGETSFDYATVAYNSDGNELWVARYNGPAGGDDNVNAIAADPSRGNVYVTGVSPGTGTSYDYATVAYDADGNELWVARYNGPVYGDDIAWDMMADPSRGNVYVTGVSGGTGTHTDYATVAYSSDGNELWVARYNGPAHGYDNASAMAADPSAGNLYVTGWSDGSGTGCDYVTIKYSLSPAYRFLGFLSPLEDPPSVNTAKAGGTVPVRFQLMGEGGFYIGDPEAVTGIWYQETSSGGALENRHYLYKPGGSPGLLYNTGANRFAYTWKTDKSMTGRFSLIVEIYGTHQYVVDFDFR